MRTLLALLLMVSVANAEQIGDMNADGQVDTVESIISLQVAAGLRADLGTYIPATGNATEAHVLHGMTFSNASGNDLVGELIPPPPINRALGCRPAPALPEIYAWDRGQCGIDCQELVTYGYLLPHTLINCNAACDNFQIIISQHPPESGIEEILCSMPPFGPT